MTGRDQIIVVARDETYIADGYSRKWFMDAWITTRQRILDKQIKETTSIC